MTTPPPYGPDPLPPAPEHNRRPPAQDPYRQESPAYPPPPAFGPPPVDGPPPTYGPSPAYGVSGPPGYPAANGQPRPPYPPPSFDAPHGYDPATGQPYSDKSKATAGLLQLLPAFFLGLGGIGRLYAGNTAIGVCQLILSGFAYVFVCCSLITWLTLVIAIPLAAGAWLWPLIDGIVMLSGSPTDGEGRPLR